MDRRQFVGGLATVGVGGPPAAPLADAAVGDGSLSVMDFGARGTGTADDAGAILAAISAAKGAYVRFPPGRYLVGRELVVTDTANLVGTPGKTIIMPAAGVRTALSISTPMNEFGTTNTASVFGLTIDGASTRGATGLLIGARDTSARIRIDQVEVRMFRGRDAAGIVIRNSVDASIEHSYFGRNWVNAVIEGLDVDLPTTTRFRVCAFREAETVGISMRRAYMAEFSGCNIESNFAEGVYIKPPPGGTVMRTSFTGCWFENNYNRTADRSTRYHLVADGTGGTVELRMQSCYLTSAMLAIKMRNVVNFVLDDVLVPPVDGAILTEGDHCSGTIVNPPLNWAGRLDRVWRNTAKHDMIVAGSARGGSASWHRVSLDGWECVARVGGASVMDDRVSPRGRLMLRRGRVTRVALRVESIPPGASIAIVAQRSPDGGRTWIPIARAGMPIPARAGSHVIDVPPEEGMFNEGDIIRIVLRNGSSTPAQLAASAAMEVDFRT